MAGLSVSAVIFDFYSVLASAAPLMHVDANKGCPPPPSPQPCHTLPGQTTQAKPQGFLSPHFPSSSFRLFILLFTPAKLLGAHKFLSVLYGSLCGMSPCSVLLYSCSCSCSSSIMMLLLANRDAFTNSCKLNLLRRACAHLMTLLAKLATRYFPGQA